jgi:superfamily II DNA or RNA helicase
MRRGKNNTSKKNKQDEMIEYPKDLDTYIGNKGYTILKSQLTDKMQEQLKKNLIAKPVQMAMVFGGAQQNNGFPIYRESSNKFYVPRYYGIETFGAPKENNLYEGDLISVDFAGSLRESQKPAVSAFMDNVKNGGGGGLLELHTAAGKCLARDTPVIMYDGTVKMVQDVYVGDTLMGDNSFPRRVQSITRGKETMYKITNKNTGESYTVNKSHILSLYDKTTKKFIDIPLEKVLENPQYNEKYLGYRVPVFFIDKDTKINPYQCGRSYLELLELHSKNRRKPTLGIPREYKINSYKTRLEFLRGIFVTNKSNVFKNENNVFIDDLFFLVRSLGFYCKKNSPTELVFDFRKDLFYDITIEKKKKDNYYGFTIDGNRRFLLGDFTVTHNTVLSLNIITQLQRKTLIIVNKEFLMNQWIERIAEFIPNARVGKIQGPIMDVENKDIVLGMLHSLSMKDYPSELFQSFGFTIIDEVHHISSEVFSCALFKIVSRCMLGLSATMDRKDGTTYVFKLFLGDVLYKATTHETHNVNVRLIEYKTRDDEFNETLYDFRGNPQYSKMIVKLCNYGPRTQVLLRVIEDLIKEDSTKQIMVLAHNKSLLINLHDTIKTRGFATVGYYVGGMKQCDLQETEKRQIVIATYSMASEALDIKTLSTLVLATPKTDIVQCVGRILRAKHDNPIIVDMIDSHDVFQKQSEQRVRYYRKCNYNIFKTDSNSYKGLETAWRTVYKSKETHETEHHKEKEKKEAKCLIDISTIDFTKEEF